MQVEQCCIEECQAQEWYTYQSHRWRGWVMSTMRKEQEHHATEHQHARWLRLHRQRSGRTAPKTLGLLLVTCDPQAQYHYPWDRCRTSTAFSKDYFRNVLKEWQVSMRTNQNQPCSRETVIIQRRAKLLQGADSTREIASPYRCEQRINSRPLVIRRAK